MKSGASEAYLPGSGNTEGSSNDGSGHGGFPLLRERLGTRLRRRSQKI